MDLLNQTLVVVGSDEISLAELLGFAFGGAAVALAAAERVLNFPVGIGMSLFFGVLFLDAGVAVVAVTVALTPILRAADDPAPFLDSLTTGMSLGAQALLNLKRLETWYAWIAVDLIYVPFYASEGLWLTAAVYVGFIALCLSGLRHWRGLERARAVPVPAGAAA